MFKGPKQDIEDVLTAPVSAVCGVTLDASGKKEYLISGTNKRDQTRKNKPAMSHEKLLHTLSCFYKLVQISNSYQVIVKGCEHEASRDASSTQMIGQERLADEPGVFMLFRVMICC